MNKESNGITRKDGVNTEGSQEIPDHIFEAVKQSAAIFITEGISREIKEQTLQKIKEMMGEMDGERVNLQVGDTSGNRYAILS